MWSVHEIQCKVTAKELVLTIRDVRNEGTQLLKRPVAVLPETSSVAGGGTRTDWRERVRQEHQRFTTAEYDGEHTKNMHCDRPATKSKSTARWCDAGDTANDCSCIPYY